MSEWVLIKNSTMEGIGNAIRDVTGLTQKFYPENMASYIRMKNTESDTTGIPADIVTEADRVATSIISKMAGNSITFLALTDMHEMGDSDHTDATIIERYRRANKNAGQAAKLISDKVSLDFFANLGDFAWGANNASAVTTYHDLMQSIVTAKSYTAAVANANESIELPGNHDPLFDITDSSGEFVTTDLITGLIGNYQYFDVDSKKVRVIGLNTAEVVSGSNRSTARMSGAQMQWFTNALDLSGKSDAADWGIIILSHHPLGWGGLENAVSCLESYVNGTSFSVTHNGVSVSKNFSGKNAAKVIANFHGHVHCLNVGDIGNSGVKRIAIPNACYGRNNEYGNEGNLTFGESTTYNKSDDNTGKNTAFCVVTIDLEDEVIYADCFGAGYDRTISYAKEELVTYSITNNTPNSTNSNGATTITKGSPYSASITANTGYEVTSVTVTMGGTDITSTAYSNGNITIANVTGNIVITVAVKRKANYNVTNLVLTSQEQNSTNVYNGIGYKNGVYDSEGTDKEDSACVTTGWIPYTWNPNSVIYIRGAAVTNASHVRCFGYIGKTSISGSAYAYGPTLDTHFTIEEIEAGEYYKLTPKNTVNVVSYIRFSLIGTGEDLIITVNEEIVEGGSTTTYTITNNLTNVTSSNNASTTMSGTSYTATISPDDGYNVGSITVTMGGTNVTSTVVSGSSINISNVTGNIVITATGQLIPTITYTNLVPTATVVNGTSVYNSTGYKDGYRISSAISESAKSGYVITGVMPYMENDDGTRKTIYIKGATLDTTDSNCRWSGLPYLVNATASNCIQLNGNAAAAANQFGTYFTIETLGTNYYKLTPIESKFDAWTGSPTGRMMMSLKGSGADLIVTTDEPIG